MNQKVKTGLRVAAYVLAAATFIMLLFPLAGETLGGVSAFLNGIVGAVFSAIPFSVFTLLVLLIPVFVGLFVWRVVANKKRRTLGNFFKNVAAVVCVVFVCFGWMMGVNYRKTSIYEKLGYGEADYSVANLVEACNYLIVQLNDSAEKMTFDGKDRNLVLPDKYTKEVVAAKARQEVADSNLSFLNGNDVAVKQTFVPRLLLTFGYDGIYFPFFAELNVDSAVSPASMCTLAVHELLHANGIMNEGEVGFLSQYICINSDDRVFRYCGSYEAVMHAFIKLGSVDSSLVRMCAQNIADEYLRTRLVVLSIKAANSGGSRFLYDIFLRLNYVSEGAESYDNDIFGWVRYVCGK